MIRQLPTLVGQRVLRRALTDRMAATVPTAADGPVHNVVIVGSGPAGHTAAIYAARAGLEPVMFEGFLANGIAAGGQLTTTSEIENFPGFVGGINGLQLTERFAAQSKSFGTVIHDKTITKVDFSARPFRLWAEGEEDGPPTARAASVIIATGASPRKLPVSGADALWQRGLSTCATCDGYFFRKKDVAVVGGGDSAAEEALYLAKLARRVYLIHRRDGLRASKVMADRVLANPNIVPVWNSVVTAMLPDERGSLGGLALDDAPGTGGAAAAVAPGAAPLPDGAHAAARASGARTLPLSGVFLAIGHVPATGFLRGQLKLDDEGYVVTDANMATSVPGVWAAGDVQDRRYRQAVTAAGSGCAAALEAERWLALQ